MGVPYVVPYVLCKQQHQQQQQVVYDAQALSQIQPSYAE